MLIGRELELGELMARLAAAGAGGAAVTVVLGPAGIGKTTVLTELARRARAEGWAVGFGRAYEFGGAPPFWPWIEALRALPSSAGAVPLDGLLDQASGAQTAADTDRFLRFDALRQGLSRRAEAAPLLILLDDAHAADVPTLLLARFLARHPPSGSVALVLAAREAPGEAASAGAAELLATLATADGAVVLGGLSTAELHRLCGADDSTEEQRATGLLHELTQGNPLFAKELATAARRVGGIGALERSAVGLPQSVRDVLRRQAERLSPEHRTILRTAAVCGREVDLAMLGAASTAGTAEVRRAHLRPAVAPHRLPSTQRPGLVRGARRAHGAPQAPARVRAPPAPHRAARASRARHRPRVGLRVRRVRDPRRPSGREQ